MDKRNDSFYTFCYCTYTEHLYNAYEFALLAAMDIDHTHTESMSVVLYNTLEQSL